jgi:hypothetical protein
MTWALPTAEEMTAIEAATPTRMNNLAPGKFRGIIEETETYLNDEGLEEQGSFQMNIRITETANPEHVDKLLAHTFYLRSKKGKIIPRAYHWLSSLVPGILNGEVQFHPSLLNNIEFQANIVYSGKYYNFESPSFVQKHIGFDEV